jgi:GNAT superfamily N-acetyltransferase
MQQIIRDGLILRTLSEGIASDRQNLAEFYFSVFRHTGPEEEERLLIPWVADLIGGHPTVTADDVFVVVDPAQADKIVSATLLIPQTWQYAGIPIEVGRPELVATDPDYQRRGLVGALFEAVHKRSAALGHTVQAITGIEHFYRRFGYTMAVDLFERATIPFAAITPRPANEQPKFTLRAATFDDIPAILSCGEAFSKTRLLSHLRTADQWRYEISGRDEGSMHKARVQMVIDAQEVAVGYLVMRYLPLASPFIFVVDYVIGERASHLETYMDVLRGIQAWAQTLPFAESRGMISFFSGFHDSLYTLIDRTRGGLVKRRVYPWYLRVGDWSAFLRQIAPVLEARLVGSGAHGYTGDLRIGFYNSTGLTLNFASGRLSDVSQGAMPTDDADVSFPYNLLHNVVFGYHNADEILQVMPDVWASPKGKVLLDALFPKQISGVYPLS